LPGRREAAFLGKLTAGATHEIKNVLATIKESCGLADDLLSISPPESWPHQEKLARSFSTIKAQVFRGTALVDRLNRLAHSPDEELASLDLQKEMELAAFLAERWTRQKDASITIEADGERFQLETDPLGLQMALFAAIQCCLDRLDLGGAIEVRAREEGGLKVLEFTCSGGQAGEASAPEHWSELEEIMVLLGGQLRPSETASGFHLEFKAHQSG